MLSQSPLNERTFDLYNQCLQMCARAPGSPTAPAPKVSRSHPFLIRLPLSPSPKETKKVKELCKNPISTGGVCFLSGPREQRVPSGPAFPGVQKAPCQPRRVTGVTALGTVVLTHGRRVPLITPLSHSQPCSSLPAEGRRYCVTQVCFVCTA